MDKKIIIQLIKQEVEELGLLINALEKQDEPQGVLVKLTKSKIHTLSKVAGLLPGNGQSKPEDALTSGDTVLQQSILDSIVESNKKEDAVISEELSKITLKDKADEESVGDYESDSEGKSEPDNSEPDKGEAELTEVQELEMEAEVQEPENEKIDEELDALPEEKTKPEEPKIDKIEEPLAEESQLIEQTPIVENEVNNVPLQAEAIPEDSEPKIQDSEEQKPRKMVLGERFTKDKSLNERFTSQSESKYKVVGKPVTSVKRAIGLNDRFMFTRELFNNDSDNYNTTLEAIDNASSFVEAIEYLEENCKWPKSETSLKFMELVKRRFDN